VIFGHESEHFRRFHFGEIGIWKVDDSLKSFVFTLKNSHNFAVRNICIEEGKRSTRQSFVIPSQHASVVEMPTVARHTLTSVTTTTPNWRGRHFS
jgi:hypothetical protein